MPLFLVFSFQFTVPAFMIPVPKTYLFTFAINFFENLSSLFHLVSSALNLAALIYDFPSRDEHGLGPPLADPKLI
ncbi:hypothetical protein V6Z11_A07G179300 [Gossypium hirsutum]